MKKISELKIHTNYDITLKVGDTLGEFLGSLDSSVEYVREEINLGTVIIIDINNDYCKHELYFDNNGKFLGFFTEYADGTNEYNNGIELVYDDESIISGPLEEFCNELCKEFLTIKEFKDVFNGDIGVYYSKPLEAVDNYEYIMVISETGEEEEIFAIIRKDKLIDFGITVDNISIANEILRRI